METLPAILESMRLSLMTIAALVAFSLVVSTLMLHRQSRMLRDVSKQVTDVSKQVGDVSKQVADSAALLRETHALTAKAAAALENVSRLVVHPGGRIS